MRTGAVMPYPAEARGSAGLPPISPRGDSDELTRKPMPVYDYLCEGCGPFTDMRPMAESSSPHECPGCGKAAPRAFLRAPFFSTMSADRRLAHTTNERSASSPQALSKLKGAHGSSCSCCSGKSLRYEKRGKGSAGRGGAKGFPSRRPWMISH